MPDSSGATVLDDLPEWLVVEEILVRLPSSDVLRCRAVRKSWRAATSTDKFILDHHRRQPSHPIILEYVEGTRSVAAAQDQKIRPVLRYKLDPFSNIAVVQDAACDGLLILSRQSSFYICNPATRKCALLSRPRPRPGWSTARVVAFYRHPASGEHRVIWSIYFVAMGMHTPLEPPSYFITTVGSEDQPRCIQCPIVSEDIASPAARSSENPPVHHRGCLHWGLGLGIMVFDTVTEKFRQMSHPAQCPDDMVSLFDLGGDLAFCRTAGDCVTLDVWVLQDYDAEKWGLRYRIDLRAMEASPPLNLCFKYVPTDMMVAVNQSELLIQHHHNRLLHCNIDGVFLGNVQREEHDSSLLLTRHHLQESLISLPLFETQQEDAANEEPPFIIVL